MTKTTTMANADDPTPEVDASSPAGENGAKMQIKQEPTDEIKDYAETTMNEMLGWYGYEKVASEDRLQLMATFSEHPHLVTCHSRQDSESTVGSVSMSGDSELAEKHRRLVLALTNDEKEIKNTEKIDDNMTEDGFESRDRQPFVCCWCQKSCFKLFSPHSASNMKPFCSELCFTQCRRASFKKNKVCDWCRHVRHTVSYVDFHDGDQQLQFCGDKCLNQYKMHVFCRETQQHLSQIRDSVPADAPQIIVTPDLWTKPSTRRNQNSPLNLDTKMSNNAVDTASEGSEAGCSQGMNSPPSSCNSRPASPNHDSDGSELANDSYKKRKVLVKQLFREDKGKQAELMELLPSRESASTKTHRPSHLFSPSSSSRHSPPQSSSHAHIPLQTPSFHTRHHHDPKGMTGVSLPPMLTGQLPPNTLMVPYPVLIPVPIPVPIPIPIPFPLPPKTTPNDNACEVKGETKTTVQETTKHKEAQDLTTSALLASSPVKESQIMCSGRQSAEIEPAVHSYPASKALHRISCACCQSDKCAQKSPTTKKDEHSAYKTSHRYDKTQRKRHASTTEPQTGVIDLSKDKYSTRSGNCSSGESQHTSRAASTTPSTSSSSPVHLMAAPVTTAYSARRSRILDAPAVFKDCSDGTNGKSGFSSNSLGTSRVSLYGKKRCIRTHIKSK